MTDRQIRLNWHAEGVLLFLSLVLSSFCAAHCYHSMSPELQNAQTKFQMSLAGAVAAKDRNPEAISTPIVVPNSSIHLQDKAAACNSSAQDYLSDVSSEGLYCWPANKLPVKVFLQPADDIPFYRSSFASILRSSFDEWALASGGKLGWVEVSDPLAANIVVRWSNVALERSEGTEAGRTKTFAKLNTVTNRGTIHGAEMTLLTRLPEREFTEDEMRKAYLHEVGHAFGIAGHSRNRDDIMYFSVSKRHSPHLADRDKATINHLYSDYQPLQSTVGSSPFAIKSDHS